MRRGITGTMWLLRRMAAELLLVAIGGAVYVVVRKVTQGSPEAALANARRLVHLESSLGIDHEHAFQQLALDHVWVRDLANWIYIYGHWPVITCVAVFLWFLHHDSYARLRNAVFASGMIGFLFFAALPMAPPRLTSLGFVDTVTLWSGSYRVLQPPQYTNIYAAMPSLHFGWDLLVGIALVRSTHLLALRVIGIVMPCAMWFAVIITGNHWILDTIVALGVVAAGSLISESLRALLHARARSRTSAPAPRRDARPASATVAARSGGAPTTGARRAARARRQSF